MPREISPHRARGGIHDGEIRGEQEVRRRKRSCSQDDAIGRDALTLTGNPVHTLHVGDARAGANQSYADRVRAQRHAESHQPGDDCARKVVFCFGRARVAVAAPTFDAAAARSTRVRRVRDRQRNPRRSESESRRRVGDALRGMCERRRGLWICDAARRLRPIPSTLAGDSKEQLCLRVKRLDVAVPEWPLGCGCPDDLVVMLEVAFAESIRRSAIEHGLPADTVPGARFVLSSSGADVVRRIHRIVGSNESGAARAPAVRATPDPPAALEHQHAVSRVHERMSSHRAAEAAANDDRVPCHRAPPVARATATVRVRSSPATASAASSCGKWPIPARCSTRTSAPRGTSAVISSRPGPD